ncbi:unannotated protein [freshwater metagenome]|uniref:Unannotated protein n=1 Tax=freshwater metagenome TaxID=449393 RepID=A0A6J7IBS3_9ZZZZ
MVAPVRTALRTLHGTHSYGWVLGITALVIMLGIALPDGQVSRLALCVLAAANLVVATVIAQARPAALRGALVLSALAIAAAVVAMVTEGDVSAVVSLIAVALVVLATPLIMLKGMGRALREQGVTAQVVLGALTFFLLIGLFAVQVYGVIAHADSGPLFNGDHGDGTVGDRMYFAFITQATVGYGDFTPAGGAGRAVAVGQAIVGQFYLVTVLALLVSNLGRKPGATRGPTEG